MASKQGPFAENNIELPQNLSISRITEQSFPPVIAPAEDVTVSVFEPEVSVKTENGDASQQAQPKLTQQHETADTFDKFIRKAKKCDPFLLWGVLRPKILSSVSLWDFLVDKTVLQAQSVPVGNVPSQRLKILLNEVDQLLQLVSQALEHCCESHIKTEDSRSVEVPGIDDVLVPENLLGVLGVPSQKNPLRLKSHVDLTPYARIFAIDESLKPDQDDGLVKEEDLKNDLNGLDLLGFPFDEDAEDDAEETDSSSWTETKVKAVDSAPNKRAEKPRQCEKCKKVFPRRQNYHFHKTKGRCPGVPQPPKYHKLHESKYFCIHPSCGSGDGEIRDSTPCFTSRGIYWKHLMEKHITDQDKVFHCEVCPEKFAYQEMLKFHLQQKHDKQYTCNFCGKSVSTRASLIKHERCHTGEKPYHCDQCVYKTASLSSLARHKRCRHDENQSGRKHVCELCGKGFFTPNSLKEHMFTHTDVKRFSCHICGKQLKNDSCYRRHMVCVHGQKYTCEICNKDFSAVSGINLHKREVHGILY